MISTQMCNGLHSSRGLSNAVSHISPSGWRFSEVHKALTLPLFLLSVITTGYVMGYVEEVG